MRNLVAVLRGWALGAALVASAGVAGAAPPAKLDAEQCRIAFVTRQMGVPVEGVFKKFDAQIALDPRKPEEGAVAFQIDVGSATLGVPQTDEELPKAAWFDASRFPKASFKSSAIRQLGGGRFEVTGMLTIKGTAQSVVVPVAITQANGQSTATGAFTIKRLAFKIGEGDWSDTSMLADDVQVRFKMVMSGMGPL